MGIDVVTAGGFPTGVDETEAGALVGAAFSEEATRDTPALEVDVEVLLI
jgi:hypothetical protein